MQSNEIDKLATALAKAQGAMAGASKDSLNFYKAKYADLASVWEAVRKPLSDNGLSVVQGTSYTISENGNNIFVSSTLLHSSGQWITCELPIKPIKPGLQEMGKEISYARRYLLSAQCGVYQVDLDADGDQSNDEIKTRKTIKTKKEKRELAKPIEPECGVDDIPLGDSSTVTDPNCISFKQKEDFEDEARRLGLMRKPVVSMLKGQGFNSVEEITHEKYEELFLGLAFLSNEIKESANA